MLLHIRESKFFKSRLVPLTRSSVKALDEYHTRRSAFGYDERPEAPFFINEKGKRPTYSTVVHTFLVLARQVGLKTVQGLTPGSMTSVTASRPGTSIVSIRPAKIREQSYPCSPPIWGMPTSLIPRPTFIHPFPF